MGQGKTGTRSLGAGGAGPSARQTTLRCFVALQPDADARDRLEELARAQHAHFPNARLIRRENLHLTLAFISALDAAAAKQLAEHLAEQTFYPFDWALVAMGGFERARVLWAGSEDARLQAMAARVRRLLDTLDIRYDRKPFVAHVTLLRKLPRDATRTASTRIEPPVLWRAAAPVLLQSMTEPRGTRYRPVAAAGGL